MRHTVVMDSLPNLGYTSPSKRWYDDAFLQESVSSGSASQPSASGATGGGSTSNPDTHIDNAHSVPGASHAHGTSDGGSVDSSSQFKLEPPLKMSKIDDNSTDGDADVTAIRMPTCLNDETQPCSSSQGNTNSHSEMTPTSANERTQDSNENASKTDSVPKSSTKEEELSTQDETPTDSTSDKDGKTLERTRQEKVEDEQTKMKLVCRVTL